MLGRLLMLCLAGLPAMGSEASSSSIPPQGNTAGAPAAKPDPEALLIDIYKDLGANRLREAQAKADALVAAYPTFRLGHLVRGDLLLMHARPVRNFGAMADGPGDKLKELRDEAMVRIRSLQEKPDPKLIPVSYTHLTLPTKA